MIFSILALLIFGNHTPLSSFMQNFNWEIFCNADICFEQFYIRLRSWDWNNKFATLTVCVILQIITFAVKRIFQKQSNLKRCSYSTRKQLITLICFFLKQNTYTLTWANSQEMWQFPGDANQFLKILRPYWFKGPRMQDGHEWPKYGTKIAWRHLLAWHEYTSYHW
jgi:hypothetical protein